MDDEAEDFKKKLYTSSKNFNYVISEVFE